MKQLRSFFCTSLVLATVTVCLLSLTSCNGNRSFGGFGGLRRTLGRGTLVVKSKPSGARVYINHRYAGKTPYREGMEQGQVYVMVKKKNFKTAGQWPKILAGQTATCNFTLEKD